MATGLDAGDEIKGSDNFKFFRGNKTDKSAGERNVQINELVKYLNDPEVLDNVGGGGSSTVDVETSVDYVVPATGSNYRIFANTTSNTINVTLPAGAAQQIIEVIDAAGNASNNIITIVGTIDGAANITIESNDGSRQVSFIDSAWESSGGFNNLFERDAAAALIKPKNTGDRIQSSLLAGDESSTHAEVTSSGFEVSDGDVLLAQLNAQRARIGVSGDSFAENTSSFAAPEANVNQDPTGWGNSVTEGPDLYSGTEGQASSTSTAAQANDVVDGTDSSGVSFGGIIVLQYDFGAGNSEIVQRVGIKKAIFGYNNACGLYGLEGSNDNSTWTTIVADGALASNIPADQDWTNGTYWDWDFSNSTSYRYYRYRFLAFGRWLGNSPGSNSGLAQFEAYAFIYANTNNTFQARSATDTPNTSYNLGTLDLKDEGGADVQDGEVNLEYSTDNGASWSTQLGLDATKALGVIAGTSLWFRIQMVGDQQLSEITVTSVSSYTETTSAGVKTVLNSMDVLDLNSTSAVFEVPVNINQGGFTVDTDTLHVDSANNRVGVGTGSPAGKLQIETTSSTGDPAAWGNGQVVVSPESGVNASGIALSFDSVQNIGYISSLTPGIAWRDMILRAESISFFVGGLNNKLRIDSDGLKFNSDTAAANALDDYEEGTWTPTATATTGAFTSTTTSGYYTKTGDIVWAQFRILITDVGTGSGEINFTLPFATMNASFNEVVGSVREDALSGGYMGCKTINDGSANARVNAIAALATNQEYIGTIVYKVA